MFTDSVGRVFDNLVASACLCSVLSGPQLESWKVEDWIIWRLILSHTLQLTLAVGWRVPLRPCFSLWSLCKKACLTSSQYGGRVQRASILRDRATCGHMSFLCPRFASHTTLLLSYFTCGSSFKFLAKFKVRKQRHHLLRGRMARFWRPCQTRNTAIAIFGKYNLPQDPRELIEQIPLPPSLSLSYTFCNCCGFLNEERGRGLTRRLDSD